MNTSTRQSPQTAMKLCLVLPLILTSCLAVSARADTPKIDLSKLPPAAAVKVDFRRDIQPVFARNCISCHGPDKQRSGLRLDNAKALEGSDSGPVIVPGKAKESRLLHVVAGLDPEVTMPPKDRKRLTRDEIGLLRAWIDQGAVWPKDANAATKAKTEHWSFQPVRRTELPKVKNAGWARNSIDTFVLGRLEKENIAPSSEADRATLIRRMYFDLLGLPPSPKEVDTALSDQSPHWYGKLVDRLLASPHYGERWGRHWLDLARYADSDGYEQDRPRAFAWRYRNWVIDALNRDLPFDRFTIEQLAGDLLLNATIEQKMATGFHRNTLTNREGGTDKEQFRVEACVDRVNTTAKVFLGLTLGCAQCHDHKYDPFSQREYYQFFAFFNSDEEVDIPAPLAGEEAPYRKAKAEFDTRKAKIQEAIELRNKKVKPAQQKGDLVLIQLAKDLAEHEKKAPSISLTPTLAVGKGRKTHVMIRGDFLRPGVQVQPDMPGILAPSRGTSPARPAAKVVTRLDLAHWLVDPANPLTPRVIANWVWHRYFGRGIVATLEDFGTQGEKPSHPELLDYLATELKGAHGWSLKKLHKQIVTSATYRQSSKTRPELAGRDPYNLLLARQNRLRLDAEIIRDNALAVSGLLNRTIGGPSVRPPQPAGISELTYANTARWVESKGADRLRRGMYTWFQRTSPYPMLMTFDAPDGVVCTVRREKSNTPLQALTLLNDRPFVECAQALAKRVLTETKGSTEERIQAMFVLCVSRTPKSAEKSILLRYLEDVASVCRADPKEAAKLLGDCQVRGVSAPEAAAWVALARTLMNLDEFVTRE